MNARTTIAIDTCADPEALSAALADMASFVEAEEAAAVAEAAAAAEAARLAAIEPSVSVSLRKWDARCRGWVKLLRASDDLPEPSAVDGAGDVPGEYLRQIGTEELFEVDAVLQGEENHRRKQRGWMYRLYVRNPDTGRVRTIAPDEDTKAAIKAAMAAGVCTMPREYLKGSGEVAAMVRILQAIRHGMPVGRFPAA